MKNIEDIKNRRQFIYYMKPYGTHVEFAIGDFYSIQKVNMTLDMYIINKYDESFYKKDTKRLIRNGCEAIETKRVNANDCVKLIIRIYRKTKLEKINGSL